METVYNFPGSAASIVYIHLYVYTHTHAHTHTHTHTHVSCETELEQNDYCSAALQCDVGELKPSKRIICCCSEHFSEIDWINDMIWGPLSFENGSITELTADLWRTMTLWLHLPLSIHSNCDWSHRGMSSQMESVVTSHPLSQQPLLKVALWSSEHPNSELVGYKTLSEMNPEEQNRTSSNSVVM